MHDWHLLQEYQKTGSQAAFARLVERYANLVYSTCLREVRDPHLAEDVMQAVFLILARKAHTMREGTILAGWLFQTARFASKNALQQEARRLRHQETVTNAIARDMEQRAGDVAWQELEPLLHDALATLKRADRDAVLLRFFDDKSLKDVGASLGISEDAARMRVARALDKLRHYFRRHGFAVSAVLLGAALSDHAVQAAPSHCVASAISVTSTAIPAGSISAAGGGAGSTGGAATGAKGWALSQQVARSLLIAKAKVATVMVAGSVVVGIGAVHVAHFAAATQHPLSTFATARQAGPRPAEKPSRPKPRAMTARAPLPAAMMHHAETPVPQLVAAFTSPRRQVSAPHTMQRSSTHESIRKATISRSKSMQSHKNTSLKPQLLKMALVGMAPVAAIVTPALAQPPAPGTAVQAGDAATAVRPERKGDAGAPRKGDGNKGDTHRRIENSIISSVDLAANILRLTSPKKEAGGGNTVEVHLVPATEYQQEERGVAADALKIGDLVSVLPRKGEGRGGDGGAAPAAVLRVDGEAKVTSTAPLTLQVGEFATVTITQPDKVELSRYTTIKVTDLAAGQTIALDASEGADHTLSASRIVVRISLKPSRAIRPEQAGRAAGKQ